MSKILCILDGFGLSAPNKNNCNALAKMPNLRRIMTKYGVGSLDADGEAVGQEAGLVGNSEVGHMNIGGLKLCPQLSFQITKSSENNFAMNIPLTKGSSESLGVSQLSVAPDQNFDPSEKLKNKKVVHLAGLFSTGCIHSDLRHWAGAIRCSVDSGVEKVVLHLFSDGRDSDKKSLVETWKNFAKQFENTIYADKIFLGSLGGRFYAMDRDKNYGRVEKGTSAIFSSYNFYTPDFSGQNTQSMTNYANYLKTNFEIEKNFNAPEVPSFEFLKSDNNLGEITKVLKQVTTASYEKGVFDEMLVPMTFIYEEGFEAFNIQKNDTVWFVNFRSDRMKQLGKFVVELNTKYELNLEILAMNDYGIGDGYTPIFTSKPVQNTLAETISKINKIDKVVLMHCRGGEKSKYFYTEIENWCKGKNIPYIAPKIAGNDAPSEAWLQELAKIKITKDTVLIGHSMGCIALCKYLSDNNLQFNSLHLVAGWQYNPNSPSKNALTQGNTFEPETINYQKIAYNGNVVLHCSKDDAPNRVENTQKYEKHFGIKANWYENYKHFDQDDVNFAELEEMLENSYKIKELVYSSITVSKIEDILRITKDIKIDSTELALETHEDWEKVFKKYQKPILKQKNYIEIDGNLLDIKKGATDTFGNASDEFTSKYLLKFAEKEGFKICKYKLFDGKNFVEEVAKTPIKISSEISYPIENSKPIESVLEIQTLTGWKKWSECSELEIKNWYKNQETAVHKLLGGKTQLHLAETEKYAHVTFFFNGGVEQKSAGEDWKVIPSNKVNSHAEIPEMKAMEITDYLLETGLDYDYIMVNYANPDMVGHTGDIEASIKSMEFLDIQLGRLFETVEKDGHSMVIIADHGNVEFVGEYTQNNKDLTDTEHNANPVPCIVINGQNPSSVIQRDFTQNWLTQDEVETLRKTALPLWKAGEILITL